MQSLAVCTHSYERSYDKIVNPVGDGINYEGVIFSDTVEVDLCIVVDRNDGSLRGIEYLSRLDLGMEWEYVTILTKGIL